MEESNRRTNIQFLCELVSEGIVTPEDAAKRIGVSVETLLSEMASHGYQLPKTA